MSNEILNNCWEIGKGNMEEKLDRGFWVEEAEERQRGKWGSSLTDMRAPSFHRAH